MKLVVTVILLLNGLVWGQIYNPNVGPPAVTDANQITAGALSNARLHTNLQTWAGVAPSAYGQARVADVNESDRRDGVGALKIINVTDADYGAVGNGITDDTTAILAAFADANATASTVYFPRGKYLMTTGIELVPYVNILGDSWGEDNGSCIYYTGTGVAVTIATGINRIDDITIKGTASGAGGILVGDSQSAAVKMDRVVVQEFTAANAYGVKLNMASSSHFDNCRFVSNEYGLTTGTYTNTSCSFINCYFGANDKNGAYLLNLLGSAFYLCLFESNYQWGLKIYGADCLLLDFYTCYWENNSRTSGNGHILVTGGAGDKARDIHFYTPYVTGHPPPHNPGTGYAIEFDYAERCTVSYPDITSYSYYKISANTQNCTTITSEPLSSVVGQHSDGMTFIHTGKQTGSLVTGDTTPSVGGGLPVYTVSNTTPITIAALDDDVAGQRFVVHVLSTDNYKTTFDMTGTELIGNGGNDWRPEPGDWMECFSDGTSIYCQVSRRLRQDDRHLVKTIIKSIDVDDDASTDDYQFDDDAANATEQALTITNIVPAYCEVLSVQLRCFETVTGSTAMSIDVGTTPGGDQVLLAANTDAANDINTTSAAGGPVVAATNVLRSLYVNATPGANWNTLDAGRWVLMVTYIDYASV